MSSPIIFLKPDNTFSFGDSYDITSKTFIKLYEALNTIKVIIPTYPDSLCFKELLEGTNSDYNIEAINSCKTMILACNLLLENKVLIDGIEDIIELIKQKSLEGYRIVIFNG